MIISLQTSLHRKRIRWFPTPRTHSTFPGPCATLTRARRSDSNDIAEPRASRCSEQNTRTDPPRPLSFAARSVSASDKPRPEWLGDLKHRTPQSTEHRPTNRSDAGLIPFRPGVSRLVISRYRGARVWGEVSLLLYPAAAGRERSLPPAQTLAELRPLKGEKERRRGVYTVG